MCRSALSGSSVAEPTFEWSRELTFEILKIGRLDASRKTFLIHLTMHSIRHYAHLVILVRQAGFETNWHMDYLPQKQTRLATRVCLGHLDGFAITLITYGFSRRSDRVGMGSNPHRRFSQEFQDFIPKLVCLRAVLVSFLRRIRSEHLDVPQHIGIPVLTENDETIGTSGLLHAKGGELEEPIPGPGFGAHANDVQPRLSVVIPATLSF